MCSLSVPEEVSGTRGGDVGRLSSPLRGYQTQSQTKTWAVQAQTRPATPCHHHLSPQLNRRPPHRARQLLSTQSTSRGQGGAGPRGEWAQMQKEQRLRGTRAHPSSMQTQTQKSEAATAPPPSRRPSDYRPRRRPLTSPDLGTPVHALGNGPRIVGTRRSVRRRRRGARRGNRRRSASRSVRACACGGDGACWTRH